MENIYRNKVTITAVHNHRGKQFAFGVVHEPDPRTVFFPHWIIKAFEITSLDQGCTFDCLFIDQPRERNPVIITILDDDMLLEASQRVGTFVGRPGTDTFIATINAINGAAE